MAVSLLVFAATWALILATWYGSDGIYGQSHPWTWHFYFKDATWFLDIAQHGYPAKINQPLGVPARPVAFFPFSRCWCGWLVVRSAVT